MAFTLRNTGTSPVEVGALGIAIIFQNKDNGKHDLDSMAQTCSMADPSISGEHGWVSVTRMTGKSQVLLIAPEVGTKMEAWESKAQVTVRYTPILY